MGNQQITPNNNDMENDENFKLDNLEDFNNKLIRAHRKNISSVSDFYNLSFQNPPNKTIETDMMNDENLQELYLYKPKKPKFVKCQFNNFKNFVVDGDEKAMLKDLEIYEKVKAEEEKLILDRYPKILTLDENIDVKEKAKSEIEKDIENNAKKMNMKKVIFLDDKSNPEYDIDSDDIYRDLAIIMSNNQKKAYDYYKTFLTGEKDNFHS
jgi:hypothetical protein